MYFNFEDNHPDLETVGSAISPREGFILSIFVHAALIALIILSPELPSWGNIPQQAQAIAVQPKENPRFVFVQPHIDMPATKPPSLRAEASDKDRNAQSPERAKNPTNMQPFARGNSAERVEAMNAPPPRPRERPGNPNGDNQQPSPGAQAAAQPQPSQPMTSGTTFTAMSQRPPAATGARDGRDGREGRGLLGSALQDLDRYVRQDATSYDNPGGGGNGQFGPSIQFDTKGVEFGPWIRRFIAQIKRNWFIPYAAMAMKGHVVIQFNVHKDGSITDLVVPGPCNIQSFNNAAYNALVASNPTQALPPEYPSEHAFFTITFYYNESPPGQGQ